LLLKIYPEGLSFFTPLDSYWKEKDWPNNPYGKELHKLYIDLTLSSYNKRKKVWYLSSKFPDVYPVVGVKEKYFHEVKGFFHKLPDDENHVELTRELVDEYETATRVVIVVMRRFLLRRPWRTRSRKKKNN
jgi:hypothetical protein